MFSGIITDVGRVAAIERRGDTRYIIETAFDTATIDIGASIAHNGVCLTVVEKDPGPGPGRYAVEVSAETLLRSTLGGWAVGTEINLERSLKLGDEIGGHLVYGHVDGVGTVAGRKPEGDSVRFTIEAPSALGDYIASKGSIAIEGVSLTVNEVEDTPSGACRFGVNIIPHTQSCTTFRSLSTARRVNLEIDMLARYTARLLRDRKTGG
jgi:riboflavin synthase